MQTWLTSYLDLCTLFQQHARTSACWRHLAAPLSISCPQDSGKQLNSRQRRRQRQKLEKLAKLAADGASEPVASPEEAAVTNEVQV